MKKFVHLLLLFTLPVFAFSQQKINLKSCVERFGDTCVTKNGERFLLARRKINIPTSQNILKANLSSLLFNNYHISYERHIANKFSVMLSYRYMPKSKMPFQDQLTKLIDNPDVNVTRFQAGGYAITPEVRFYAHKNMVGFYIAPYARFANFDVTLPIKYSTTQGGLTVKKDADFTGTVTSISGGVLFGTQHQIFKKLTLDIWIIGDHFGNNKGNLNAVISQALSTKEQQDFQATLNNLDASPFTVIGKVTSPTSAVLITDGPWAGVRGAGFTLGFRF